MADEFLQNNRIIELHGKFKSADKGKFFRLLREVKLNPESRLKMSRLMQLVKDNPQLQNDLKNQVHAVSANKKSLGSDVIEKTPENIDDLRAIMLEADFMKAVGAKYAFSNIAESKKYLIHMNKFNSIREVDETVLNETTLNDQTLKNKNTGKINLMEVGAGATIEKLNQELKDRDLALVNQPGYEKLTYWGAATVGGHGSGFYLAPLANYIKSIKVLLFEDGKLVEKRIEPGDGITNKEKYNQKKNQENPNSSQKDWIISDDKTFYSFLVSMGCMGVVISYIVEVRDFFKLKETRQYRTWDNLKGSIIRGILEDKDVHSVHIWFNPYKVKGSNGPGKEIWCLLSKYEYPKAEEKNNGKRGMGVTSDSVDEFAYLLSLFLEIAPEALAGALDTSLRKCINRDNVILPCYEALNFGTPNEVEVEPTNCGIPYEKFDEVLDELFVHIQSIVDDNPVTSPIGVRFTSKGIGFLSPQYNRQSCMIELPLLKLPFHNVLERNKETLYEFNKFLMGKYFGKPHWGQRLNEDILTKDFVTMFGQSYADFKEIYAKYGKGRFNNKFTELLKLDE